MPRPHPDKMIPISAVAQWLGVGRSTVRRWVSLGRFPPPYRLSPRRLVWRVGDVQTWLAARRDNPV